MRRLGFVARETNVYRFDAVINTFCGGDVSGVQDMKQIFGGVRCAVDR